MLRNKESCEILFNVVKDVKCCESFESCEMFQIVVKCCTKNCETYKMLRNVGKVVNCHDITGNDRKYWENISRQIRANFEIRTGHQSDSLDSESVLAVKNWGFFLFFHNWPK